MHGARNPGDVGAAWWCVSHLLAAASSLVVFRTSKLSLGPSAMITQKFSFQSDSTGLHLVLLLLLLLLLHLHRHITDA
jgi:hypothetical protein